MNLFFAVGIALAYSGLTSISFTMDRHYADIRGRGREPGLRTRVQFRLLGWLGIALSFFACITANGWHTGPVLWIGILTVAAIMLTLLLQYAPHKAIRLACMLYPSAIIAGALLPFIQ